MKLLLVVTAFAASLTAVSAQLAGLSSCILNCSTNAAAAAGCSSIEDAGCVCTSATFQNDAGACLIANCSTTDQQTAASLQSALCGNTTVTSGTVTATIAAASGSSSVNVSSIVAGATGSASGSAASASGSMMSMSMSMSGSMASAAMTSSMAMSSAASGSASAAASASKSGSAGARAEVFKGLGGAMIGAVGVVAGVAMIL